VEKVTDYLSRGLLPLFGVLMLVALVLSYLMRRSSKGARAFRAGFCTIVTGRKGHGKSIFSVHEALRHLGKPVYCKKCTKKPELRKLHNAFSPRLSKRWYHYGHVATNCSLSLPARLEPFWIHVASWDDLATWSMQEDGVNMTVEELLPHGTLVIIDEAHLWCPARAGEVLPARQKLLLSQCRKLVLEAVFITQNLLNVAVGLRRQTDEVAVCRKGMFGVMVVRFWDPEEVERPGKRSLWKYRYRVTRRVASAYDTFELILPAADGEDSYGVPSIAGGRRVRAPKDEGPPVGSASSV